MPKGRIRIKLKAYDYRLIDDTCQKLVDTESWKGPFKPHHDPDDKKGFTDVPDEWRDKIHDMIESCPSANMERHPASQENGSGNGGHDEHVHVFGQEEKCKLDP